jgi:hypothetical protein
MFNITDLVSWEDYFLLIGYAIVFYFIIKHLIFKKISPSQSKLLLLFFSLKVVCIVMHAIMVMYVWKLADSVNIFLETQNLAKVISHDFSNIKFLFRPAESYINYLKFDSSLVPATGSDSESNFFLIRICAFFYPIALGKYLILAFAYCAISTVGIFKLYLIAIKIYPKAKRGIQLSLLFIPTVLFFGSPIYKETLCLAFIGFASVNIYNIYLKKKNIHNYLILIMKPYIIYVLLLSFVIALVGKLFRKIYRRSIIGKFICLLFIIITIFSFVQNADTLDPYVVQFVDISNFAQQLYNNESGEGSNFEFGELNPSMSSLILRSPLAFYTTYFRPNIWEARNFITLWSAVESMLLLLFTIYLFIKKLRYIGTMLNDKLLNRIILNYIIIMGILIGLTTFNFGSLSRYKIVSLPFAWLFLFVLSKYTSNKKLSELSSLSS